MIVLRLLRFFYLIALFLAVGLALFPCMARDYATNHWWDYGWSDRLVDWFERRSGWDMTI